ncbi:MAG: hypothetical protein LAN83_03160 [Acidobacteriia bacterium]|nr:hypothetical protein [Terriglobia bacterium]
MRTHLWWVVLLLAPGLMAQSAANSKHARPEAAASVSVKDFEEMQRALAAQQEELTNLRQELQQAVGQVKQMALEAQQKAASLEGTAEQDRARNEVTALQADVSQLKTATASVALGLQEQQKETKALESPLAIHYKGITITPGGFLEAASIYRTHNENGDVTSTFANIPLGGSANSQLSEFRGTGRQSRIALLGEGKAGDWKLSGYYEADFLGAAPTANELESSSFNLRQRQLWAQAESSGGFSFLGGQSWSLLTTSRKGMTVRQEFIPLTIDSQYVVGYNWARQWGARFTKNFNNGIWAAVSVENPETNLSVVNPPPGVFGFNNSPNATSPGSQFTLNNTPGANGISTDVAPDLIAKLAFEPGFGHYEIKAVGRFFRDRIGGNNNLQGGGGAGFGAILPATKKVDVILEALAGRGIGRYASGLGPDVTLRPTGTIMPIQTLQTMAGIEAHPSPKLDLYIYGGDEYYGRSAYVDANGKGVGYGSPRNDVSGCSVESPSSSQPCQAQTRTLWQIQPGYWYRFYKGPVGTMQFGMSYSYTYKNVWAASNGPLPKGVENMIMTSFRYYLP